MILLEQFEINFVEILDWEMQPHILKHVAWTSLANHFAFWSAESVSHFYHRLSYTHLVASDSLVFSNSLHVNEIGLLVMKFVLETTKFQESS